MLDLVFTKGSKMKVLDHFYIHQSSQRLNLDIQKKKSGMPHLHLDEPLITTQLHYSYLSVYFVIRIVFYVVVYANYVNLK